MQDHDRGMGSTDASRTAMPRGSEAARRYGTEYAERHRGRSWQEVEPELRRDWDGYEHRGDDRSTWDQMKASVKDAWDRVTGGEDRREPGIRRDERTRI